MNYISRLGYSRYSPYQNSPFLDIESPNGLIDMSNTDIPLLGIGLNSRKIKLLRPRSGTYSFFGDKVIREIPLAQTGGEKDPNKEFLTNWYTNRVITDPYIQEGFNLDKPAYLKNLQNFPEYTFVENIDPTDPNVLGRYDRQTGQLLVKNDAPEHTKLHELNHFLNSQGAGEYMRTIHKDIVANELKPKSEMKGPYAKKYDYFSDPDEIHSRIMVLRQRAGFKPNEFITSDRLSNFLKDYKWDDNNINDIFWLAKDPMSIINMLNFMAKNDRDKRLTQAKNGGEPTPLELAKIKAKMALESHFGNPSARRMTTPYPQDLVFKLNAGPDKGKMGRGTHWMYNEGNYTVPIIQEGSNRKLFFNKNASPSDREAIRFDSPEDAASFAEYYKYVAPMMRNNFRDGGDISIPNLKEGNWLNRYQRGGATTADSLEVYNNALAIKNYYDNLQKKGWYKPVETVETSYPEDYLKNWMEDIKDRSLNTYRSDLEDVNRSGKDDYNFITFKNIYPNASLDDYKKALAQSLKETKSGSGGKYYYKDLLPSKIDPKAPSTLVNLKISPNLEYTYRIRGKSNKIENIPPGGSVTSIFSYNPLSVKPYYLRTPQEKIEWEILYGTKPKITNKSKPKPPLERPQIKMAGQDRVQSEPSFNINTPARLSTINKPKGDYAVDYFDENLQPQTNYFSTSEMADLFMQERMRDKIYGPNMTRRGVYEEGGSVTVTTTRPPIYVTNPNDPRLRAYRDSLNLYNKQQAWIKANDAEAYNTWNVRSNRLAKDQNDYYNKTTPLLKKAIAAGRDYFGYERISNVKNEPREPISYLSSVAGQKLIGGTGEAGDENLYRMETTGYKKPVQPYILQNKKGHLMTPQDWQDVNSNDYGEEELKIRNVDQNKFDIYRLPGNKFEIVPKQKSFIPSSPPPQLKMIRDRIGIEPLSVGTPFTVRPPSDIKIKKDYSGMTRMVEYFDPTIPGGVNGGWHRRLFPTTEEADKFMSTQSMLGPSMTNRAILDESDRTEFKKGGQHGGLDRWFAEKWVDVKTGKTCGRQEGEKRGYPACRPSKRVSSQTPKTSSELSSEEKAKFKRTKTSSKRIPYNHKRN